MEVLERSLQWSNHGSSLAAASSHLLEDGALADVTLSAEGHQLQAHKFILAVSSPYFKQILMKNPCQHPVIILRDVRAMDLKYLLLFMYQGHVNVPHSCLFRFMELAKALEIVGVTQTNCSSDSLQDISESQPRKRRRLLDDVSTSVECSSPGLQLKTEIQDLIEMKVVTGEAVSSPPTPLANLPPAEEGAEPLPTAQPQLAAADPDGARQVPPEPDCLSDNLHSNHDERLETPSNHQPGFNFDNSCDSDSNDGVEPAEASVTMADFEEFFPALKQPRLRAGLDSATAAEKQSFEEQLRKIENLILELKTMIKKLGPHKFVLPAVKYRKWTPASTEEELQTLLKQEDLASRLVEAKEMNLARTTTSMLKLLMTRDFALSYSMTGLGARRTPSKAKFDGSDACRLIEQCLKEIPEYKREPKNNVKTAIRNALKGAIDWDGHRSRRRTHIAEASEAALHENDQSQEPLKDKLDVKLRTSDAASFPPSPLPNTIPADESAQPAPTAQPQPSAAAPGRARQVPSEPDCLDDNPRSNHNKRLGIASNLQSKFSSDRSCDSDSSDGMELPACSVTVTAAEELLSTIKQHPLSPNLNTTAAGTRSIESQLIRIEDLILELKTMIQELSPKKCILPAAKYKNWTPASTEEELQNLLMREDLAPRLVAAKEVNVTRTATSMLKLLMTRDFALTYSMTGLGARRTHSKERFDGSEACRLIEQCIKEIPEYREEPRRNVKAAIRNALKGAIDWDGHRSRRKINIAEASEAAAQESDH